MIIDGKALARQVTQNLVARVDALKSRGIRPGFDAILVGDHAPSQIYVANKQKAMQKIGIECAIHHLPVSVTQYNLLSLIDQLNADKQVHGILVQLPLPIHCDTTALLNAISPAKDVDGLGVVNVGRRTLHLPSLLPCTPKGCMTLLRSVQKDLTGLHAVVVGRSNLVGKPMAQLLLEANCTVTQAHSKTVNLAHICRSADILVAAVGQPGFIKGDWIKDGAIVIDVGINRVASNLVGDVDFATAQLKASAITPVPGGVGPMTIASLLENTVEACENQAF